MTNFMEFQARECQYILSVHTRESILEVPAKMSTRRYLDPSSDNLKTGHMYFCFGLYNKGINYTIKDPILMYYDEGNWVASVFSPNGPKKRFSSHYFTKMKEFVFNSVIESLIEGQGLTAVPAVPSFPIDPPAEPAEDEHGDDEDEDEDDYEDYEDEDDGEI